MAGIVLPAAALRAALGVQGSTLPVGDWLGFCALLWVAVALLPLRRSRPAPERLARSSLDAAPPATALLLALLSWPDWGGVLLLAALAALEVAASLLRIHGRFPA